MRSIFFILFLALLSSNIGHSQDLNRPKLAVGIVVDQMRWDYLYRYDRHYSENGFKRFLNQGFSVEKCYIPYIPSYTAPGHASIYTGSAPAIHGIVGNDWTMKNDGSRMYCTQDDEAISIGGGKAGKMSPKNLLTTTIGDELKLATNQRAKVYGISMKDRGAILPAGHIADAAFWYDNEIGHFISSSFYMNDLPKWLKRFNKRNVGDSLMLQDWYLMQSKGSYYQSIEDDNPYEGKSAWENKNHFPHLTSKSVAQKDKKAILSSPHGNSIITLLAKELIQQEQLGQGKSTDMIAISYSSTDYIGHRYGPNSLEIEDTYIRLDRELSELFNYLDRMIGKDEYIVFLSADHAVAHNANYLQDLKVPAQGIRIADWAKEANQYLEEIYGIENIVNHFWNYQVHFNENIIKENKLDRIAIKKSMIQWLRNKEGITTAFDLEGDLPMNIIDRFKNSSLLGYHHQRSGSIQMILNPAWYSMGRPTGTTHGSWNPYDTHIPLLFYGKGIPKGKAHQNYSMLDIAPTLAALLKIQEPNGCIGEVIQELVN